MENEEIERKTFDQVSFRTKQEIKKAQEQNFKEMLYGEGVDYLA